MTNVLFDIAEIGFDLFIGGLGLMLYFLLDLGVKIRRSEFFGKIYRSNPGYCGARDVAGAYFWSTPFAHAATVIWLFSVALLGGVGAIVDFVPFVAEYSPVDVAEHSHPAMFFSGTFVHVTLDKLSGWIIK
jgi:hypothetical protein